MSDPKPATSRSSTSTRKRGTKQRGSRRHKKQAQYRQHLANTQLFALAELITSTANIQLKRSYIRHMRAIAQKIQLSIPKPLRFRFCRRCSEPFTFLPVPTYRVRIRSKPQSQIIYTCLNCGYIRRQPFVKH